MNSIATVFCVRNLQIFCDDSRHTPWAKTLGGSCKRKKLCVSQFKFLVLKENFVRQRWTSMCSVRQRLTDLRERTHVSNRSKSCLRFDGMPCAFWQECKFDEFHDTFVQCQTFRDFRTIARPHSTPFFVLRRLHSCPTGSHCTIHSSQSTALREYWQEGPSSGQGTCGARRYKPRLNNDTHTHTRLFTSLTSENK